MSLARPFDAQSRASDGRVVRSLKDGYWDRTEVIELPDGSRRVRKRTKGAGYGPWSVQSLQREIRYLQTLPAAARPVFPALLTTWDEERDGVPDVGYEMPLFADHVDAGELARRGALAQEEVDALQDALADAVCARLHEPVKVDVDQSLTAHVKSVVGQAWTELEKDPVLAALINAEEIDLNGARVHGPRAVFAHIEHDTDALTALDVAPWVRLHGDLFLENILWRPSAVSRVDDAPRLILVDPVSVAGISHGPPVFDLVKYESYATGELLALRSEWVEVGGFTAANSFHYGIRWDEPVLVPFRTRDWHTRFRRAFEAKHGAVDLRLYRLVDGYFSAAMAVNTGGLQRRSRLLKAIAEFNAALAS